MQRTNSAQPGEASGSTTLTELPDTDSEAASHHYQPSEFPDPFYDEHADSEDERWIHRNMLHVPSSLRAPNSQTDKPGFDTIAQSVSCPCCFSLLSLQTQPHVRYEGQFRALFVTNCKAVTSQRLRVKGNQEKQQQNDTKVYQPIACSQCFTEVGVRDQFGVYHFCDVMY